MSIELVDVLLWLLAALFLAGGLVGLVLPAIPGPPLLFAAAFCAAWAEDFVHVGKLALVGLGLLAVIGVAADFIAGALGARKVGASGRSITGATLGAIVGLFFGLPGILLGPFVGAAVGELSASRNLRGAGLAGVGATVGVVIGTAAKIAVGVAMIASYLFIRLI